MCRETLDEGTVLEKKRGIQMLIEVSEKRGLLRNKKLLSRLDEVSIHDACRKRYTVGINVKAAERRGGDQLPGPSSRFIRERPSAASGSASAAPRPHMLGDICFLCGEKITEEFLSLQQKLPVSRRNDVRRMETLTMKDTIIIQVASPCGEWGKQIRHRISFVDLFAAEGRYHIKCHKKLYSTPRTTGAKRGRPDAVNLLRGMECMYAYLEETREECQFSIDDLVTQNFQGDYKPNVRTVETHLKRQYGDKIMFAKVGRGHTPVLVFKDVGQTFSTTIGTMKERVILQKNDCEGSKPLRV